MLHLSKRKNNDTTPTYSNQQMQNIIQKVDYKSPKLRDQHSSTFIYMVAVRGKCIDMISSDFIFSFEQCRYVICNRALVSVKNAESAKS